MKLLICNIPVELDFSSQLKALETRMFIVMTFENNGYNGFLNWEKICRKHNWVKKSYENATKTQLAI